MSIIKIGFRISAIMLGVGIVLVIIFALNQLFTPPGEPISRGPQG